MQSVLDAPATVGQKVTITILGPANLRMAGEFVSVSGRYMRLLLGGPVPADAPVRVDLNDSLLLGEVCYCRAERNKFAVGLSLEQSLSLAEVATSY